MHNQRAKIRRFGQACAFSASSLIIPSGAWAQPFDCGYGYRSHMWGGGGAGLLGLLLFFLLLVAAIVLAVLLVRWLWGFGQARQPSPTPLDILKERLARGEIDKQEFEERRQLLGE